MLYRRLLNYNFYLLKRRKRKLPTDNKNNFSFFTHAKIALGW